MTRIMGIDAGEARVGLAVGDGETRLATPLSIIERGGRGLGWTTAQIVALACKEGAAGFVVGLPLNIDGTEGGQASKARALGIRLAQATRQSVEYWDERMSSFIAEHRLKELSATRRRRNKHADDLAAAVILQSYFDALAASSGR